MTAASIFDDTAGIRERDERQHSDEQRVDLKVRVLPEFRRTLRTVSALTGTTIQDILVDGARARMQEMIEAGEIPAGVVDLDA